MTGDLPKWSTNILTKTSEDTTTHTGTGTISEDQQSANELPSHINRKFKKHEIYYLIETTFGALCCRHEINTPIKSRSNILAMC